MKKLFLSLILVLFMSGLSFGSDVIFMPLGGPNWLALETDLIPATDDTYDLGSATKEWKDLYVDGTANLDDTDIDGTVSIQPAADSTTAVQILDAAGAVVGNFDTTNKRFGIGVASPGTDLHIVNASSPIVSIDRGGGAVTTLQQNASDFVISRSGSGGDDITIQSDGDIILSSTGGDRVGIATTAPDAAVEINHATGDNLRLTYNDGDGTADYYADFQTTSTGGMRIDTTTDEVGINIAPANPLTLYKDSGSTIGSDVIIGVQGGTDTGDLSQIGFGYSTGTSNRPVVIGHNTTGGGHTKGTFFVATRDVSTDTAPTERMTINSDGTVDLNGNYFTNSQSIADSVAGTTSLWFDGVDDVVTVSDDADLDFGTGDFSLMVVAKLTGGSGSRGLVGKGITTNPGYGLFINTSNQLSYYIKDAGGDLEVYDSGSYEDNSWHTFGATFDRDGNGNLYVDGDNTDTTDISARSATFDNANDVEVGKLAEVASTFFPGSISRTLLFNLALSAAEVMSLSSGGAVPFRYNGDGGSPASQTEATSGTLVIGKAYRINDWITNDDFTNVGGTNEDGNEFVATGTTPTTWTNSSTVVRIGCVADYNPSGITAGTWVDASGNDLDGTVSGAIVTNPQAGLYIAEAGASTPKMVVDESGNVGIGVTPTVPLHIRKADAAGAVVDTILRLDKSNAGSVGDGTALEFGYATTIGAKIESVVPAGDSGDLRFHTRNSGTTTERMRIDSAGNVGIGTTPSYFLDVKGSSLDQIVLRSTDYPSISLIQAGQDNTGIFFDAYYGSDWESSDAGSNFGIYKWADLLRFRYDSGIAAGGTVTWNDGMVIDSSGNVGIGTGSPTSELSFGDTSAYITMATSDASDDAVLSINGGGTYSAGRGAYVSVHGNEHANTGELYLAAGNVTGGDIHLKTEASDTKMIVTKDGNVGIGNSALESWTAGYTALQVGGIGAIVGNTTAAASNVSVWGNNWYLNAGDKRIINDQVSRIFQTNGSIIAQVAEADAADSAISWTTAQTINADGKTQFPSGSGAGQVNITPGSAIDGLFIDQDNSANAITIDSESTTGNYGINVSGKNGIYVNQEVFSGVGGMGLNVIRTSTDPEDATLVQFKSNDSTTEQPTLFIDHNGSAGSGGFGVHIDSENAAAPALQVESANIVAANIQGGLVQYSVTAGITATNPGAQGDTPLTSRINEVSTVGTADDAVTLPSAVAGMEIRIINNGANQLEIWPASGDNAGGGVDTAVTLAAGSNVTYVAYDVTNWEAF